MYKKRIRLAGCILIFMAFTCSVGFPQTVPNPPVSSGDTVSVGDTLTFWAYRASYFYIGYYKTEAICRAVGEKCYIFVEKARWNFGDVDSSDVESVLNAFEKRTDAVDNNATGALASTAGIYDKVTSVFGQPPDFDNDPKMYILLLDVEVQGRTGWQRTERSFFGPMSQYGFFDPKNEYSARVDSMSNEHELLYLDCVPTDPSSPTAHASLAHSLQRMIHWYNDPNEERWLSEGCSMLAQFLCGYGVTTGYFPPMDPFVGLTFYSDEYGDWNWEPSVVQNSMLLHFYFEKFGEEFMSALVADDEHQGVESIDSTLQSLGSSGTFSSIFEDFALTWYFLSLGLAADSTFLGGKYSLKYLTPENVRGTIVNSFLYWGLTGFLEPPYPYDWTSSWSAAFIAMTTPFSGDIDSVLVFNGEDGSEYSLVVIKGKNDWLEPLDPQSQVEFISLDAENRGYCDVSGFKTEYKTIYMAIVTRWLVGRGTLYISDDITPPGSLHVVVFHGPIDDRSLDIYVFASEEIISGQGYVPTVEFTQDSVTSTIGLRRFRPYSDEPLFNEPHVYHGDYFLSTDGVIDVRVTGQDVSGNHAPDHRSRFTVEFVPAKTGGRVSSPDGKLTLEISAHSFSKNTWVTVFPHESDDPTLYRKEMLFTQSNSGLESRRAVGKVYRIGPTGGTLNKPALLIVRFDEKDVEGIADDLGIYRSDQDGWKYVRSVVNREDGLVSAWINRLGEYQIQAGPQDEMEVHLPSAYELGQNYPNPFNGTTTIRYAIPDGAGRTEDGENVLSRHVRLNILNILGQKVKTLLNEEQAPGFYKVQWDGRDEHGNEVASGIYFYRLSVANSNWQECKRMVLLK